MLIDCPNCAAGFQVPERLLRDPMRPLRCGQCGTVFPIPEPPASEPEPLGFHTPEPPPAVDEPSAIPMAAPDDTQPKPLAEQETFSVIAHEASSRRLRAAWAASIVLLIGGGLAAIIRRDALMEAWPPATRLFAALGLG